MHYAIDLFERVESEWMGKGFGEVLGEKGKCWICRGGGKGTRWKAQVGKEGFVQEGGKEGSFNVWNHEEFIASQRHERGRLGYAPLLRANAFAHSCCFCHVYLNPRNHTFLRLFSGGCLSPPPSTISPVSVLSNLAMTALSASTSDSGAAASQLV